ncbi:MAG: hypothetical protein HY234_07325 [Acidobacteria bacterium]|nr:hypothetical protein [Acidobacteriota bacterium]MBI3662845.1 hypothetical protein [Acidobacteriota bacterium]
MAYATAFWVQFDHTATIGTHEEQAVSPVKLDFGFPCSCEELDDRTLFHSANNLNALSGSRGLEVIVNDRWKLHHQPVSIQGQQKGWRQ